MTVTFAWTSWEFWVLVVLLIIAIGRREGVNRDVMELDGKLDEVQGKLDSILKSVAAIPKAD